MTEQKIISPHNPVTPSADMLKSALDKAGVAYKTNDNGDVIADTAVSNYLDGKNLLHDPHKPTIVYTEGKEKRDYVFEVFESEKSVSEAIAASSISEGDFPDIEVDGTKKILKEYVGPIQELRGKRAHLVTYPNLNIVCATFNDTTLVLNGRALGFGGHPFASKDFGVETKPNNALQQFKQALASAGLGSARFDSKGNVLTGKAKRKGTKGAFGSTPKQQEFKLIVDTNIASRGLVVSATSYNKAVGAAREKSLEHYPNESIIEIRKAL